MKSFKIPNSKRIVIGLTGGFGSGKSTVLKMLVKLGATSVDADVISRRAMVPGGRAYSSAVKLFGKDVLLSDGTFDRALVARRVFKNPILRKKLEKIIHPLVKADIQRAIRRHKKGLLVLDIPLLFEAGLERLVDVVAVVWAPEKIRIQRLLRAGHFTATDIRRRIAAQLPLSLKRKKADFVIDNSGTMAQTRRQIMDFLYGLKMRR